MKDTLCIGGGHSHHQFGVNLVGFHTIIFTVYIMFSADRMLTTKTNGPLLPGSSL